MDNFHLVWDSFGSQGGGKAVAQELLCISNVLDVNSRIWLNGEDGVHGQASEDFWGRDWDDMHQMDFITILVDVGETVVQDFLGDLWEEA